MTSKILITGATGTLGTASSLALAGTDSKFFLHYNKNKDGALKLKSKLEALGSKVDIASADLSQVDEIGLLIRDAQKKLGGIDLFINTASIFEKTPLGTVTEEEWNKLTGVDLKATFFLSQEIGMLMQRTSGKIILFSDVAAMRPYAGYLPYCISKAGVNALVKGLARALAPRVQVNAIAPYVVTRPEGITDKGWSDLLAKIPNKKPQSPEEIAAAVKWLASSAGSLTGQIISIDGGRLLNV